jgi:hypothetical protein
MSVYISTDVWKHSNQSGSSLLLMLALADISNDDGHAWPGVVHLANKTQETYQDGDQYHFDTSIKL